jgi:hypothetical protein
MRAYMTDTPRNTRNKIIPASKKNCACPVPKKVITRDSGLARQTRIATFYGSEFSANREGDSLNIYEDGEGSVAQRRLVSSFFGKAFFAEIEADEISICLVSDGVVATSTLGDRVDTKMTPAKYQQKIIGRVRRLGLSR